MIVNNYRSLSLAHHLRHFYGQTRHIFEHDCICKIENFLTRSGCKSRALYLLHSQLYSPPLRLFLSRWTSSSRWSCWAFWCCLDISPSVSTLHQKGLLRKTLARITKRCTLRLDSFHHSASALRERILPWNHLRIWEEGWKRPSKKPSKKCLSTLIMAR